MTGAYVNLPAVLVVLAVTSLLVKGIQESARFNVAMVAVKLSCVLFVLIVGGSYVNPSNSMSPQSRRQERRFHGVR